VLIFISAYSHAEKQTITCMLKTLFRRCKQHQIVHKKQTVDPAAYNSDTFVDTAVTVYPIHVGEGGAQ